MANRSVGSTEQYTKRSNRILLILGLGLIILAMIAYCGMSGTGGRPEGDKPEDWTHVPTPYKDPTKGEFDEFGTGVAEFEAQPGSVNMSGVVLGSAAESVITLRARQSAVIFAGMELAEKQQDGFTFGGTCAPNLVVQKDDTCTIKVMWNPTSLRQIQNVLEVRWKEDNPGIFDFKTLSIPLSAQSTDSKNCVICESSCKDKEPENKRMAVTLDGKEMGEVDENNTVIIGDKIYDVKGEIAISKDGGMVVLQPKRIPLDLNNKLMGTVSLSGEVLSANGEKLGRILGDGTIVDPSLQALGAAIPVVSVIDANGKVIGKVEEDGTVIDGSKTVIGRPLVDGSVVDLAGVKIGYLRPYGLAINFTGEVIGGVMPDGTIVNNDKQVVGTIKPNGMAINPDGELSGGVVPEGVAVGPGCKSLGSVLFNGKVKDSFSQIIGKVLLDGSVIDDKQNDIGTVIRMGLVINEKGVVVGFVNSEGKAVDNKGAVIGCVNPDGTVSAGSKIVGAIMPKGMVIGRGCQSVGSVYPNGVAMNGAVEVVGTVFPDSYVRNANSKIIGVVVPRGSAIADGCRLLGLMTPDGEVIDGNGLTIGCLTPEKEIVNNENEVIGFMAPRGLVLNNDGKVIGRARPDGKVIDSTGKVIGCVNADGSVVSTDGKTYIGHVEGAKAQNVGDGAVLDENGDTTDMTVIGDKVYNKNGEEIGTLTQENWVVNKNHEIINFVPPDGVIFSHNGLVMGRYSRKTGVALTAEGERFGYVLPDYSVLNSTKDTVIGVLIPDKEPFMTIKGDYLATMTIDGLLQNADGETLGAIKSNGTVVDRAGEVVGMRIPQGRVLSALGVEIGSVNNKGEVLSMGRTVIGSVLGNGLAVSREGSVLGAVFPAISLPMGADGVLGALTDRATVNDKRGRQIAIASPFGTVIGQKDNLSGRLVRIGPYVDSTGKLVGWANFKGGLNDKSGSEIGKITVAGIAIDSDNRVLGTLAAKGAVVDASGKYLGTVSTDGQIYTADGKSAGVVSGNTYVAREKDGLVGQLVPMGVAVNTEGGLLGWTNELGGVEDAKAAIGTIAMDGRVMNQSGEIMGTYVPFGTLALSEKSTVLGLVGENGYILQPKGERVGAILNNRFVYRNGQIVGRLMNGSLAVNDNQTGKLVGLAGADGIVMVAGDNKPLGNIMTNGFVSDLTKKVMGGLSAVGLPVGTKLNELGIALGSAQVVQGESVKGTTLGTVQTAQGELVKGTTLGAGNQAIYDTEGKMIGGMRLPETFIDRNGAVIGQGTGTVMAPDGKKVGTHMPFGSVLTVDTIWAGGAMPLGVAINDDGYDIGIVSADGTILGKENVMMGRILSDGTAVGLADKNAYSTMPYAGHIVKQGLALGYKNIILGRTTVGGDIIDANNKKAYRELDDGTILGTDMPLVGTVLSFNPTIGNKGEVLGVLDGEGNVVSYAGDVVGHIATNGAVKGNHKYKILGTLVPEPLIVDNCKVIGQTAQNGQVVNGQGNIVGHIAQNQWAVDSANNKIGRAVQMGLVASPNGDYLGRTLPDSTVVDTSGVNMGCARNDGKVVNGAGEEIGHLVQRGAIIDKDGNVIGRVKHDGLVVDGANRLLGKVLGDGKGTVVNNEGQVIGRVVPPSEEMLFNQDGKVEGTLTADGIFKDRAGNEQFQALPDGRIVDTKTGATIGTLTDDGRLLDQAGTEVKDIRVLRDGDGNLIGTVDDDGNIINADGEKVGQIMPDGSIVDENGKIIGQVNPDGSVNFYGPEAAGKGRTIYGPDGKPIGTVDADGNIRDKNGRIIGRLNPDGSVKIYPDGISVKDGVVFGPNGEVLGTIDAYGNIRDKNGKIIGHVNPDGSITLSPDAVTVKNGVVYGPNGEVLGTVDKDGNIRDKSGKIIGKLNPDGSVTLFPNAITIKNGVVFGPDGEVMGTVDENGDIRDKNGNIIGHQDPDGGISLVKGATNITGAGQSLGSLSGGDLSKIVPFVGHGSAAEGVSGRRIFLGDQVFTVTKENNLVDKDGNIIGYLGPDGRPHSMIDDSILAPGGKTAEQKTPPPVKPFVATPEQAAQIDGLLGARRAAMKSRIRSFERMLPDAKTMARARKKEDADWGEPKTISTYPVDMSRMILKDKAIPAVLAHSIDSRFASVPVTAIVERHIYAEQGRRIIIPAGSRLIGSGGGGGGGKHVNKMTFSWNRLIRPDGSAFKFSGESGDAQGRGGVPAYLDEQLLKKYGRPVLESTLTSAIAYITATNDDVTTKENGDEVVSSRSQAANDARSNFIDSMSQIFQQLLDEAMDIEEVVFVPAGTRMTVYPNTDLWLRSETEDEQDYLAAYGADTKHLRGSSKGNWVGNRTPELTETAANQGIAVEQGTNGLYYEPEVGTGVGGEAIYDGEGEDEEEIIDENGSTGDEVIGEESESGKPKKPTRDKGNQITQPIFPRTQR